jgi:multidrug transporter EmrE-like cation transporter
VRRQVAQLVAIVVLLAGAVFALQGLRVLPSRIMYGRPEWIVIGTVMIVVAGMVLWRMRRERRGGVG